MPRSSAGSQNAAGRVRSQASTGGNPAVRDGGWAGAEGAGGAGGRGCRGARGPAGEGRRTARTRLWPLGADASRMPCPRQGARGSVGVWNDVALARQLAQEVEDGLVECRVLDLGRDVGEGNQHEPAQVKEGMRDLEPVLGDDLVRVKQDVDVQRSLTRGAGRIRRRDAARPALDRLGQAQEPVGWEIGFDLDRAVEVPYLARRAQLGPRRRFIDLGASD